jgi:hypothetical protein
MKASPLLFSLALDASFYVEKLNAERSGSREAKYGQKSQHR